MSPNFFWGPPGLRKWHFLKKTDVFDLMTHIPWTTDMSWVEKYWSRFWANSLDLKTLLTICAMFCFARSSFLLKCDNVFMNSSYLQSSRWSLWPGHVGSMSLRVSLVSARVTGLCSHIPQYPDSAVTRAYRPLFLCHWADVKIIWSRLRNGWCQN